MSLRTEAIQAMGSAVVSMPKGGDAMAAALDGLLNFLQVNYSSLYDSIPTTPPWDGVLLGDVMDLLGEKR